MVLVNANAYADRIESVVKTLKADRDNWRRQALDEDARANATRDKSSQVGNAAALRVALSDACHAMFNFLKTHYGSCYEEMANALDKAKAALAEPLKNCEVGTPEEQYNRFIYCCTERKISCRKTFNRGCAICYAKWMQMPYEKGGNDEQ
jgi:molecular chaperone DnaK (HSP70)